MMKRYPVYKDSGVEWIGKIPDRWSVAKIKFSDFVIMGQSPSSEDYNDSMIGLPFLQGNADFTSLYPVPRIWCDTAKKQATAGDVLLSVRAPIGAVNIADQDYGIGRGLCAIRSLKTDSKLHFYLTLSLNEELNSQGTGSTFTAISADDVGNLKIPSINSQEQGTIVKYLDHKTHLIDTLIEKKQKQIELLQEQRAAIINQAVTKGLNPNVKMKDSGIEWLGEVPEHWQTTRLKFETSRIVDCLHSTPVYSENGGYPAIRTADVSPGVLDLADVRFVDKEEYKQRISRLQPEAKDILYSREGERFGMAALVPHDVDLCLSQRMMMFRPRKSVNPIFLMWQLNSRFVYYQASQDVIGATSPHVNVKTIRNFSLVMPPYKEQTEIAENIHTECANIDAIIGSVSRVIKALQEYRTTLISEIVTGKIDVRNEVIP